MSKILVEMTADDYTKLINHYFKGPRILRFGQSFVNAVLSMYPPEDTKELFYEANNSKALRMVVNYVRIVDVTPPDVVDRLIKYYSCKTTHL